MKLKEQRYFNSKGFVEKRLVYLIKGRLKFQAAFNFSASTISLNTLECPRRLG